MFAQSSTTKKWYGDKERKGYKEKFWKNLLVEILNPSTAGKDWLHKRWTCEAAGVPEYLVIDPDARLGVLEAGRYLEAPHGVERCVTGWADHY